MEYPAPYLRDAGFFCLFTIRHSSIFLRKNRNTMAQIDEIKAKIKALRAETEANSITPVFSLVHLQEKQLPL